MTPNNAQIGSNWRGFSLKLGFELAVIIAGILIALAINEWQKERENREYEQEYIRRLIDDMESNLDQASSLLRWEQSTVENARRIYPLVQGGAETGLNPSDIVAAAYWASPVQSPNWNDATHQELLSSGRYVILENANLRGELLRFYEQSILNRQMFDLASTAYRETIRSEFNPELQISIRQNCSRFEVSCDLEGFTAEIDRLLTWMSGNDELSKSLGRIIPQAERGSDYATRIKEASESLISLLESELDAER